MLLFCTSAYQIPRVKRHYRKRASRFKVGTVQLSLFDFVPRQLQLIFHEPLAIPNVVTDKIVSQKEEKKMKKTVFKMIVGVIQEGTIPLLFLSALGFCIGVLDYATMARNLPNHFSHFVAYVFGVLIGFGPVLLLALRQYQSLAVVAILAVVDVAIAGVDNSPFVWLYFAAQVGYLFWKITVFIAAHQGDINGNPVQLDFFRNLTQRI